MEKIQKIKCLIVDDEPIARKIVKNYINQIAFLELEAECKNGIEALEMISKVKDIQIIFLDINMPNLNGLAMAKILKNNISIIFTTAYTNYAVESYDVNAIDYLLKPFSFERFATAVFKAIEKSEKPNETLYEKAEDINESKKIFIKSDGRNFPVFLDEILYCEAMKNYTKVVLVGGKNLKPLVPFSKIEQDLSKESDDFIRVHRSFIISINKIISINNNHVFIDKYQIPIGPQYKDSVMKIIGLR